MKNILYIFLCLIVCFCNNKSEEKIGQLESNNNFFEISYEDILNSKRVIPLSQLASDVEYIKFETNKDCIIGQHAEYFFTDSSIFVNNFQNILKFSRNGKFIKKIGSSGRGPGEINIIASMSIIPENKLIVVQNAGARKLVYFSFDGNFVKSVSVPYFESIKAINDGNFITYEPGYDGNEEYNFILTNESGDTIDKVRNYYTFENPNLKYGSGAPRYSLFRPYYSYRKKYFFKTMYNDTIYFVEPHKNRIERSFNINLGKLKLPTELRPERIESNNIIQAVGKLRAYYYCNVFESGNKIFISSCSYAGYHLRYMLYDKTLHLGSLIYDGSLTVNGSIVQAGFINDIDGGIDFWPVSNLNDNQIFMPISILDLQKVLDSKGSIIKQVKSPKKRKKLLEMISKSDGTDNPILMVITINPD